MRPPRPCFWYCPCVRRFINGPSYYYYYYYYLAFAFSISLPPSTPLITLSYCIVFLLSSVFLNYPCKTLYLTYHSAHQPFPSHLISLSICTSHLRIATRLRSGPILFNMYTTPLCTLISLSSISHLLYADDTQLFISFIPQNFPAISTYNLLNLSYLLGCHLTTSPLILPKLNFFLLDFHIKLAGSSTHHFPFLPPNAFLNFLSPKPRIHV